MKIAVYFVMFLAISVGAGEWRPQAAVAQENPPIAQTEALPQNKKPPAKDASAPAPTNPNFYLLPPSPSRPGKDMCGNPVGTSYGEGYKCPDLEQQEGPYITYKSPWEKSLNIIAAILAVLFAIIYALFHWIGGTRAEEWAARNLIVILIIGSAVFILTAGYDDKQAAPLFGLLGTMVGYLFGRAPQERPADKPNDVKPNDVKPKGDNNSNSKQPDADAVKQSEAQNGS